MQKNGTAALENRFEALKESVRNLVDAGGERASHMKDRAIDVKDTVFENGERAFKKAGSFIKEHPIIAITVAFGVGYLAVRMMRK